jgi:pimeloyl-ACP methyl ester carboxylesterase
VSAQGNRQIEALRGRTAAIRWPEKENRPRSVTGRAAGDDAGPGALLGHRLRLRAAPKSLNALPQFMTEIDGLDIHFIHVRSPHENPLPLIITHGWPGSVVEMLNVVGRLTDPTAHDGTAEDAFHLAIPPIPGYGLSGKPDHDRLGRPHVARAWAALMQRLGHTRYMAQGGDWGAIITDEMGAQVPNELLGIHSNMPGTVPPGQWPTPHTRRADSPPHGLAEQVSRTAPRLDCGSRPPANGPHACHRPSWETSPRATTLRNPWHSQNRARYVPQNATQPAAGTLVREPFGPTP